MPDLGSADRSAGHIIDLHSFSVRVQAGKGYFSFADILVFKAVQVSLHEELPVLT